MQTIALRPRSPTEVIDTAFRLCRMHYGALLTATAIIVAPAVILKLFMPPVAVRLLDMLENLLFSISDGAVIAIISDAYLGRDADARIGLRAAVSRFGSLLGSTIARNILLGLGLVFFLVPGVFVFAWTFAVPMVIVLEGETTGPAFSRARDLARGHVGHVLATLVLLLILVFGPMIGMGALLGIGLEVAGIPEGSVDITLDVTLLIIYPLYSVGGTLLYYDLRIRKEGFDLEMMARDMGEAPGVAVPVNAPGLPPG